MLVNERSGFWSGISFGERNSFAARYTLFTQASDFWQIGKLHCFAFLRDARQHGVRGGNDETCKGATPTHECVVPFGYINLNVRHIRVLFHAKSSVGDLFIFLHEGLPARERVREVEASSCDIGYLPCIELFLELSPVREVAYFENEWVQFWQNIYFILFFFFLNFWG